MHSMMRERKADRQKNHNLVDDVPDNGPPIASDLSLEEEVCMYVQYVCMYVCMYNLLKYACIY